MASLYLPYPLPAFLHCMGYLAHYTFHCTLSLRLLLGLPTFACPAFPLLPCPACYFFPPLPTCYHYACHCTNTVFLCS